MQICILRHGETEWNNLGKLQGRENIPLSAVGIKQISDSAKYLKKFNWAVIITSPLSRAKKSAEIISKEIGNIKIIEEMDFIERDYGKASGMTSDETKIAFPDGNWIGVEPDEILQNRTIIALQKYIKEYNGKNFIIVSHGSAINSILAHLSENTIGTGKTALRNASITLLRKIGNKIEIAYYNKIANELM
jgi:uncharacterized phosphatase